MNYSIIKIDSLKLYSKPIFWLFLVGCSVFFQPLKGQQSIQFSQYIFNGLSLNPGYAGYKENLNLNTTYRTQWTGLAGAPTTFSASVDGVIKEKKVGLGFSVLQDQLGAQSTLSALASVAYRLQLNEASRLSLGISAGIDQYNLDNSKLRTLSSIQSGNAITNYVSNQIRPDLQFGLFYASRHYFWGLSVLDLLSTFSKQDPTYFIIQRNRHFYLHAGGIFYLSPTLSLKPSFLIKDDLKAPANLDVNTFLIFNRKLWVGGSIRTSLSVLNSSSIPKNLSSADAASIMIQYFPNSSLRIGYSFDYTTSHLQQVSSGSHEISIGYTIHSKSYPMLSPRLF